LAIAKVVESGGSIRGKKRNNQLIMLIERRILSRASRGGVVVFA